MGKKKEDVLHFFNRECPSVRLCKIMAIYFSFLLAFSFYVWVPKFQGLTQRLSEIRARCTVRPKMYENKRNTHRAVSGGALGVSCGSGCVLSVCGVQESG